MTDSARRAVGAAASEPDLVPADAQPSLPVDRFLIDEPPGAEAVPMDVLFVGGGPAGLAGAIQLAKLVREDRDAGGSLGDLEIGVLEKSEGLGEHCLSGAVVNPRAFRSLFPDLSDERFPFRGPVERDRVYYLTGRGSWRIPAPPSMRNHGHFLASVCEIVRWLGEQAEQLGVNLFTGFPADALLLEGGGVVGVRTTPAGLDRSGQPASGYMPPTDLSARVTVLAEGTRGPLTQAYLTQQGIGSPNPQIYALGVKELWQVPRPVDGVIHSLGWPLPSDAFGGSWLYPMGEDLASFGLVVGLDYRQRDLDVHALLQRLKEHPLFAPYLEGGELVEWGAKTIPEGGYYSLPERLHGDGLLIVGDAAGFVDVASLKGIHYAMQSGILAACTVFEALKDDDPSAARLAGYDTLIQQSFIPEDLYRTRNMRLVFKEGLLRGGLKAGLQQLTLGRFPGRRVEVEPDADVPRAASAPAAALGRQGAHAVDKLDAVYRSGNSTRDDIPSHLIVGDPVTGPMAQFYEHMCPAGVYERQGDELVVNPPNCVDCKATDVLGPRWTPREGGSGPSYKRM